MSGTRQHAGRPPWFRARAALLFGVLLFGLSGCKLSTPAPESDASTSGALPFIAVVDPPSEIPVVGLATSSATGFRLVQSGNVFIGEWGSGGVLFDLGSSLVPPPWPEPLALSEPIETGLYIGTDAVPSLIIVQVYTALGSDGVPVGAPIASIECGTGDIIAEGRCRVDSISNGLLLSFDDASLSTRIGVFWIAANIHWIDPDTVDTDGKMGSVWATWLISMSR